MESRMISSPICLYDCDVPADGATAIVVSAVDTVPDLRAPVRIAAMAGVIDQRPSWEQWEDMGRVGYATAAAMWNRTDLTPDDVHVAQLYDGFTIEAVWWLEAMGFCGQERPAPSSKEESGSHSTASCRSTHGVDNSRAALARRLRPYGRSGPPTARGGGRAPGPRR